MDPTTVGTVIVVCTFGGVLVGIWLRGSLPEVHLNGSSTDTINLGMGLVVTMTALVLGLVTASAKTSFDSVNTAAKHMAIDLLTLDRLLARLSRAEIRRAC